MRLEVTQLAKVDDEKEDNHEHEDVAEVEQLALYRKMMATNAKNVDKRRGTTSTHSLTKMNGSKYNNHITKTAATSPTRQTSPRNAPTKNKANATMQKCDRRWPNLQKKT